MSNTAIDQLFQITTPTHLGREASRASHAQDDRFRSHLDRATETTESKTHTAKNKSKPSQPEEDEPLEAQSGQQETSTTEREQAAATAESSESKADTVEEAPPAELAEDEVTLSAAVARQQQPKEATAERVLTVEAVVAASLTGDQQQNGGQTSPQLARAIANSVITANGKEAVELEAALLGESSEGEAASNAEQLSAEGEVEKNSTKTSLHSESFQSAVTSELKIPKAASAKDTSRPLQGKQLVEASVDNLPEDNAPEGSTDAAKSSVELPFTAKTGGLGETTDAELALANRNSITEATANLSHSTSTPTTNDTIAVAGRTLGNVLASQSAEAASTNADPQTTETSTIDRARFVQRVGGAIRAAQLRDGQIQLRLSPPELGTLRIQLTVSEGAVTAHLETDNAAARTVLLDNLPALRERLAEQEIRIEKFDVDVGRDSQQQADHPDADDPQTKKSHSQSSRTTTNTKATAVAAESKSDSAEPTTTSGLDVRI